VNCNVTTKSSMERLNFDNVAQVDDWEVAIHLARYSVVADLCEGKTVLDIACGEGYGAYLMATRWGAAAVDAYDISKEALEAAQERFSNPKIQWRHGDADQMTVSDFPRKYDVIISLETIEHINNPAKFIATLARLLKPGGLLCVSCPNDSWYYGEGLTYNRYHKHVWTFEQFREMADTAVGSPGQYLIGSTAKAICAVPFSKSVGKNSPGTLSDRVVSSERGEATFFTPVQVNASSPSESLYFLGLWGDMAATAMKPHGAAASVSPERLATIQHSRAPRVTANKKPVIVLAADIPGWAYCNIAHNVKRFLGASYDIQIVYLGHYNHWSEFYYDAFWKREASLVHVFWREFLYETCWADVAYEVNERFRADHDHFIQRMADTAITTSVYDHLNVDETSFKQRELLFSFVDSYFVSSDKLLDIYSKGLHNAPDLVIEDGVDPELFTPHNLERFSDHNRPLVIGWAGNSAWCENKDYDPKGFKSIIMPAIESLKSEGLNIDGLFADASQGKRPRSEMPKYYNSIDLYVCASEIEGTPNPILECMSCGVPAVSSDVGVVPQVFGPLQYQFLLKERNVEAFKNAIRRIYNNRSILQGLSQENLSQIQSWSWQDKMGRWLSLFQLALSRLNSRNIARKKHLLMGANLAASDELSLRGIVIEQQKISRERNRDNSYLKSQLDDKNRLIQDLLKERETLRLARRLSQGEVF